MTETEVRRIVRREIDSYRKQESGELPPTPYVVMEIIRRCKTLRPWKAMGSRETLAMAIRHLVEEILGKRSAQFSCSVDTNEDVPEAEDLQTLPPEEAADGHGARKKKHLRKAI